MNREEKTLLLQLILEDLRGNWGDSPQERAHAALEIAEDLGLTKHVESICGYIKEAGEYADWDGRYFRTSHEHGGYEGMEVLHGLTSTYQDKSREFQWEAGQILTFPEYRFTDYTQPVTEE